MSVINRMLQDLENRHAVRRADIPMSAQVKAVPKRSRVPRAGWVLLALMLAIGAGMVVWLLRPAPALESMPTASARQTGSSDHRQQSPLPPALAHSQPALSAPQLSLRAGETPAANSPVVSPQRREAPEPPAALPRESAASSALDQSEQESAPPNTAPRQSSADAAQVQPATQAQRPSRSDDKTGSGTRDVPEEAAVTKQIKEISPQQRAESEYRKAVALLQSGRVTQAAELLDKLLQLDPGNAAARQMLAGLLVDGKRYGEAQRRLQDGLKLDPGQTGLAMILARLQVEQGNTQSGLLTLQNSLPYAAQRPDYQAFLAALLQREGRHQEAIEHYLQALRKAPESGVWLMGLAISLQAENRLAEAREAFRRASASNTLSPDLQAFVEQQLKQSRQQ